MTDSYIYAIAALLPLAALMLVFQVNPYHALVIRGILGAVAVLVYTVLGAADVALTEALVGTLLAVALYAVAVRSSLVLRLGVLQETIDSIRADRSAAENPQTSSFQQLIDDLQAVFHKHYMRVELVPYPDFENLHRALMEKEVHATCIGKEPSDRDRTALQELQPYHTTIRLRHLYEIVQAELVSPTTRLSLVNPSDSGETH